VLESVEPFVENLDVTVHDQLEGTDGRYDFNTTARFSFAGMRFLVLVEAKRHSAERSSRLTSFRSSEHLHPVEAPGAVPVTPWRSGSTGDVVASA
jgi:hypothetical protein